MLSIIIPALNEQERIEASVMEAIAAAEDLKIDYEVILVDDGSRDSTWQMMEMISNSNDHIKLVRNPKNIGLGGSYKAGLSVAAGNYITWVPADLSHKRDSLYHAYSKIGSADMIIPFPNNPEVRSLKRRLISKCYTYLVNKSTGFNIPYYNGLSIHRKKLLDSIEIKTNGFGFQAEIIVKLLKHGASFSIADTFIDERTQGKSKAFTRKNMIEVSKTLLRIVIG